MPRLHYESHENLKFGFSWVFYFVYLELLIVNRAISNIEYFN